MNGWTDENRVPNPWVALAARPDLSLVRSAIDVEGRYYDEERSIVIRAGLDLCEERQHLWHELVHSDRRDRAFHTDARVERLVDHRARENAMPWESIKWAWDEATDLEEMADLLKLPQPWVYRRLTGLHPAQKALLRVRAEQYA